jgi:hypothetical protein
VVQPEHRCASAWLRLCPDNRISGTKVLGKGRLPTNNRASIALRMAASTLRLSVTYLGAQVRRFRTKLGAPLQSKPWLPSWRDWSTACSATGRNTWTRERNSTKPNTANDRSDSSNGKPPIWDFALLKLQFKTPRFLRVGVSGETSGPQRFGSLASRGAYIPGVDNAWHSAYSEGNS